MKNPFKKLAALCVTAYAKKIYEQAVELAEDKYKEHPDMYFVITDPAHPKKLMCINMKQFLDLRHRYHIPSKALTVATLKNQCWYRTKSKTGVDAMSFQDITVRKLAFCRELLKRAKLA